MPAILSAANEQAVELLLTKACAYARKNAGERRLTSWTFLRFWRKSWTRRGQEAPLKNLPRLLEAESEKKALARLDFRMG